MKDSKVYFTKVVILADSINIAWLGMMKEEEDHYLYGREERDPRKRKRMSEEVFLFDAYDHPMHTIYL